MNKRYLKLNSLRGIAALLFVFQHYLNVLPSYDDYFSFLNEFSILRLIKDTLFPFLQNGHESVILFFFVSGFVLSLFFYFKKQLPT
ncbi:hypothetical protein [Bacillus cereus group sp. BfR-BA-01495]|uniref:hypothetical protein n=1 Tax=Bacillus cereus group sp. BfR-BA-01495 TaxID=2920363 RepID=UPI001F59847F|nr:hypothetical protein [Bacillus cereus group sp. BfR-BA-01495]